ncbi:dGTPase [Burkholderia pseudomallei]|uniref:dGTPase n=2 Tax=Burkholderia pseudomallei TaxID=28450 RepID=UPI0005318E43|nr:dGTPase [Burkholderia pseudomallei]KGS32922.1 dGTPase family protein [Burkholderia pseudomallei MSHR5569]KGU97462.1 dGTPase family protein [Burkholderia pseudomallei MSHR4372]MBM5664887.1 dGTPase [Burkholderia pseudomallei]
MARKKNSECDVAARYRQLLQVTRFRPSEAGRTPTLAVEAASDRGRILFSNAFRRLQSKTQVFDQELNASVRTRLTHSLEVASVGRYIADVAAKEMLKRGWLGPLTDENTLELAGAVVTFVEVACLMHDLGNPPFGHFGESTMQTWFEDHRDRFRGRFPSKSRERFDHVYRDFLHFDGNPQGFRIAAKLQWVKDEFGYNLTHTQLAAMLKYPWSTERVGKKRDGRTIKKAGVFLSEADTLRGVHSALGMSEGARHPLAYLMEAADDISYCLSDIEDALEKNVIRGQDFVKWLRDKVKTEANESIKNILSRLPADVDSPLDNASSLAWYVRFRTDVTNTLVGEAAKLFIHHQADILDGSYFDLLDKSDTAGQLLGAVKGFSREFLYTSRVVRQRELLAFEVVTGILDRFGSLLDLPADQAYGLLTGQPVQNPEHVLAPTLCSFLGKKQLLAYRHAVDASRRTVSDRKEQEIAEWFARAHLLADYVSGMTDDYAIASFQRLYAGGPRYI